MSATGRSTDRESDQHADGTTDDRSAVALPRQRAVDPTPNTLASSDGHPQTTRTVESAAAQETIASAEPASSPEPFPSAEPESAQVQAQAQAQEGDQSAPAAPLFTLLVVGDDPTGAFTVPELLDAAGTRVRIRRARNLTEAERLLTDDVHCILLDLPCRPRGRRRLRRPGTLARAAARAPAPPCSR